MTKMTEERIIVLNDWWSGEFLCLVKTNAPKDEIEIALEKAEDEEEFNVAKNYLKNKGYTFSKVKFEEYTI